MFQKNDLIELSIEDMGVNGEGIGKSGGFTFFVKDTVPGDRVRAKVMKLKRTYGYAKLTEVLTPSADRVVSRCSVAKQCGGCSLQEMSYEAQLAFKERLVKNDLMRLGGFPESLLDEVMQPIIGMEEPFRYRNKAQFPIGRDKDGVPVAGFYAARTHSLVPVSDCLLGIPENQEILRRILKWMKEEGNTPYEEKDGTGSVRHVLIRKGFRSGEILVCLVVNEAIRGEEVLCETLREVPGLRGISLNYNRKQTNVILGDRTICLWGEPVITDQIGETSFEISPESFYQVNPVQTEQLYGKALEYAGLTGTETVWDLYCGIGTISLFLAKRSAKVYGVEVVPRAIEDARRNAALNHIRNAEFFVGKVEEVMPKLIAEGKVSRPDVIVVDPPRKGCDPALLDTVCTTAPQRVVYVSCDPATLSRDLRILCDRGYNLRAVTPVDMFPQTRHVETVCILSKLSSAKEHIEVTVDMDELDLTSAEAKTTYNEIRDWVQEHYRMHVTNLNIAQVKQKNGIIERENYNKSKSPDSKQPQCPEEKIKAMRNDVLLTSRQNVISRAALDYAHRQHSHRKAIGGITPKYYSDSAGRRRCAEPTTTFNYYDNPKDNLVFERCIEAMSRLMMKYGPALLEKMEREKLEALIKSEIDPVADNGRLSKRLLGYCQLMKDRK